MYEDMTYEYILKRMLSKVSSSVDKREGSIIYDALAPAAAELVQAYISIDTVMQETYGLTASREYLIKRARKGDLSLKVQLMPLQKVFLILRFPLAADLILINSTIRLQN